MIRVLGMLSTTLLLSCQSPTSQLTGGFGDCVEYEDKVVAGCLYGTYPPCELDSQAQEIALNNVWLYSKQRLAPGYYSRKSVNGRSHDLGEVCRFYVADHQGPEGNFLLHGEKMVYVSKEDLVPFKMVPVKW